VDSVEKVGEEFCGATFRSAARKNSNNDSKTIVILNYYFKKSSVGAFSGTFSTLSVKSEPSGGYMGKNRHKRIYQFAIGFVPVLTTQALRLHPKSGHLLGGGRSLVSAEIRR
jgi:hypothetical protein